MASYHQLTTRGRDLATLGTYLSEHSIFCPPLAWQRSTVLKIGRIANASLKVGIACFKSVETVPSLDLPVPAAEMLGSGL